MATSSKAAAKSSPKTTAQRAAAAAVASDNFDLAQKIAWYAILAMVFLVPIAMSNYNFKGSAGVPLTFDQFDTIKVFIQRVGSLIALAAWGWHLFVKGGKLRRTPVDWIVLGLLGWFADLGHLLDPSAHGGVRQVPPLRGAALVHQLRAGLLPGDPARRPRQTPPSDRPNHVLVRGRRERLRRHPVPRPRLPAVGPAALRAQPRVLDLRQPRPPGRLHRARAAGGARARSSPPRTSPGASSTGRASS